MPYKFRTVTSRGFFIDASGEPIMLSETERHLASVFGRMGYTYVNVYFFGPIVTVKRKYHLAERADVGFDYWQEITA